jgi:hypothetical protein
MTAFSSCRCLERALTSFYFIIVFSLSRVFRRSLFCATNCWCYYYRGSRSERYFVNWFIELFSSSYIEF